MTGGSARWSRPRGCSLCSQRPRHSCREGLEQTAGLDEELELDSGWPVGGRSVPTPIHGWAAWKAMLGGPSSPAKGAVINWDWGAWIIQHPCEGRPHPALSCGWRGDLPSPRPQAPHLAIPGVQGGQTPQTPAKNRPKMAVERRSGN